MGPAKDAPSAPAPPTPVTGEPASRRVLRTQGRRTMRKLLDAAMVAFDTRGYHATRVNDVVELAETSHGTFYLYFSNKEDLLRALVAEASTEAARLYRGLTDPPTMATWEDLRAWIGQYSEMWTRYGPLLRSWTDLADVDPEIGDLVRSVMRSLSSSLATALTAAGRPGDVDPDVAGVAAMAMLDRFHYLREFLDEPMDDEALDALTTLVYRMLRPE